MKFMGHILETELKIVEHSINWFFFFVFIFSLYVNHSSYRYKARISCEIKSVIHFHQKLFIFVGIDIEKEWL